MKLIAEMDDSLSSKVRCTMFDENGKRTVYTLSIDSFVTAVNSTVEAPDFSSMPPLELPEGYVASWFNNYNNSIGFTGTVVIKMPAAKRIISYEQDSYYIPIPELLFKLWFANGKLVKDRVFATRKGQLCRYPFTNVYDDGHICWGSCELPLIKSLKETEQIPELFMRFTGNSDLSNPVTLAVSGCRKMADVFKILENMEHFPDEWLEMTNLNYEEFINLN